MEPPITSQDRAVLEVTLGQRALPSVHGEQTTATAYAGLGSRHLLLAADGAAGPVPSRLAAQIATAAAAARFRASVFPSAGEQLVEAVAEAHQAVRRGALGTHAEGQAGASLTVVVVEPSGVTAARVGGGRVYIMVEGRLHSLFRDEGRGHVGDQVTAAEIASYNDPLPTGSRIIAITESVVRSVAADLDQLAAGPAPQLAAARIAEAARRRGQYEPLAVQVCEIQETPTRFGHHPAFARIDRAASRTLTADGRWLGKGEGARARAHAHGSGRAETGWIVWFFVAALLGAGAALIVNSGVASVAQAPIAVDVSPDASATAAEPTPPPNPELADALDAPPDAEPEALPAEVAAEIAALFDHGSPNRTARAVRNYITRRWPRDGDRVFTDLERWIGGQNDPAIIAALLELMKDRDLKRTVKWLEDLLPRLYGGGPPETDAEP